MPTCLNYRIHSVSNNKIYKKISSACQRRLGERISRLNYKIIETSNNLMDKRETELYTWEQVEKELDFYNC